MLAICYCTGLWQTMSSDNEWRRLMARGGSCVIKVISSARGLGPHAVYSITHHLRGVLRPIYPKEETRALLFSNIFII